MIRKSKKFSWPRKLYDKQRILDENKLVKKYGLKNKREIWKAESKVRYFRNRAKVLITSDADEQKTFFNKLNQIGLKVNSVADVLGLQVEDLLKRRISTILFEKKLASTPKQGRQMVVHKKVIVGGRMIDSPSYLVKVEEEKMIKIKSKVKKPKKVEEKVEEAPENSESVEEEKNE